jgi:hypothetical protein
VAAVAEFLSLCGEKTMTTEGPIIRPARSGEAELLSNLALRAKTMRGEARHCIEEIKDGECPTESQLLSEYMRIVVLENQRCRE